MTLLTINTHIRIGKCVMGLHVSGAFREIERVPLPSDTPGLSQLSEDGSVLTEARAPVSE